MKTRLCILALLGAFFVAHVCNLPPPATYKVAPQLPYGAPLPNDCAIVATEASSRLIAAHAWARILFIQYIGHDWKRHGHALTVWQPLGAHCILAYDDDGTIDLPTKSHDALTIARAFGDKAGVVITKAKFL